MQIIGSNVQITVEGGEIVMVGKVKISDIQQSVIDAAALRVKNAKRKLKFAENEKRKSDSMGGLARTGNGFSNAILVNHQLSEAQRYLDVAMEEMMACKPKKGGKKK